MSKHSNTFHQLYNAYQHSSEQYHALVTEWKRSIDPDLKLAIVTFRNLSAYPAALNELHQALLVPGLARRFSWRGTNERLARAGDGVILYMILGDLNLQWTSLEGDRDSWPSSFFDALAGWKIPSIDGVERVVKGNGKGKKTSYNEELEQRADPDQVIKDFKARVIQEAFKHKIKDLSIRDELFQRSGLFGEFLTIASLCGDRTPSAVALSHWTASLRYVTLMAYTNGEEKLKPQQWGFNGIERLLYQWHRQMALERSGEETARILDFIRDRSNLSGLFREIAIFKADNVIFYREQQPTWNALLNVIMPNSGRKSVQETQVAVYQDRCKSMRRMLKDESSQVALGCTEADQQEWFMVIMRHIYSGSWTWEHVVSHLTPRRKSKAAEVTEEV